MHSSILPHLGGRLLAARYDGNRQHQMSGHDPVFELFATRFRFRSGGGVYFPPGRAGNVLRGALGITFRRLACVPECTGAKTCPRRAECAYARLFEPVAIEAGPSGFSDLPRPFVIRARSLDGRRMAAGDSFEFDVHIFDLERPALPYFAKAFSELVRVGLGAGRPPAELTAVVDLDERKKPGHVVWEGAAFERPRRVRVPLTESRPARRILVRFLSPTELKSAGRVFESPEFAVLFARARDRVASLSQLYGAGRLDTDFRALGERARQVRLTGASLRDEHVVRHSTKTGQTHPLGGFVGSAEYEGELGEFLPWLEAASWTGVGRQTVWGKGHIETDVLE